MRTSGTLQVGAARVTILNAGDLVLRLADEMAVPEAIWRPKYAAVFDQRRLFPSQSVYIAHPAGGALVDINDYPATVAPDSPYLPPDYTPPPGVLSQLATLGVRPDDIQHVVITHAHWDHFAGTTRRAVDEYAPSFPHARHYLGAADWENAETQAALREPDSLEARTLGTLHARGLLELVNGGRVIADGVEIRHAPGESPGHQVARVHSEGQTLYVLGDLFHDPIEVEHPEWMVTWADPETMLATRRAIMTDALAENALLVAAHI
ncbi:MAG TPA: MBL fold metallo-hydrolase, partial [Ktedonobacterales bacterium]|nr:MBL fold metallo-hydrolase [Ktedonobacterales bacterium]